MSVVGICDFPPIEMHDGWGSLKEVVVEGKGGPAPNLKSTESKFRASGSVGLRCELMSQLGPQDRTVLNAG